MLPAIFDIIIFILILNNAMVFRVISAMFSTWDTPNASFFRLAHHFLSEESLPLLITVSLHGVHTLFTVFRDVVVTCLGSFSFLISLRTPWCLDHEMLFLLSMALHPTAPQMFFQLKAICISINYFDPSLTFSSDFMMCEKEKEKEVLLLILKNITIGWSCAGLDIIILLMEDYISVSLRGDLVGTT